MRTGMSEYSTTFKFGAYVLAAAMWFGMLVSFGYRDPYIRVFIISLEIAAPGIAVMAINTLWRTFNEREIPQSQCMALAGTFFLTIFICSYFFTAGSYGR